MARPKRLITFAHLNDQHGDLTKCWFVEYSFQLPDSDTKYRRRIHNGLGSGTETQRRMVAANIIEQVNRYLKSGEYLKHDADYSPVGTTDMYRPEAQRFAAAVDERKISSVLPDFLAYKKPSLAKKSYQDYTCKLSEFADYVRTHLKDCMLSQIKQQDICLYLAKICTERNLCRGTVEKHEQIIRNLFQYAERNGIIAKHTNPVYEIPDYGRVIDCSPVPYSTDDRTRLRSAIEHKEPFLWLACETIYYCAIRPGTELRLLKIKHLNRETATITVPAELAKNNTTESVHIPAVLMEQLERLNVWAYGSELYIFGKYGIPGEEPTGKNTMRNRFNRYRDMLHISTDHKFYSWKHSGAISAISNGASTYELKSHLRHKSFETTENYIHRLVPNNDTSEKYIDPI